MEDFNWGNEFCKIIEILPSFTPFILAELSLPQFLLYARYANEQKAYQANLKNIDEYIEIKFCNKSKNLTGTVNGVKGTATGTSGARALDDYNSIENILAARDRLKEETGRTTFTLPELTSEIKRFNKIERLKKFGIGE